MDLDFVLVHKHAKKELGQYPAILTSHLVNNPYLLLLNFVIIIIIIIIIINNTITIIIIIIIVIIIIIHWALGSVWQVPKTPAYKPHFFAQNFRIKSGMRLICENIWTPCRKFA